MAKLKVLFYLLVGALLISFAVENSLPGPNLRLLRTDLGNPPVFLLVFGSFGLGFLGGWLAHFFKARRRKRDAALAAKQPEPPDTPQK